MITYTTSYTVLRLLQRHQKLGADGGLTGRQVADRPGAVIGQLVTEPTNRRPHWMPESLWQPDTTAIRYGGDQTTEPVLVVRRVDRQTARITDIDGNLYSPLMRIEDAIQLLNQAKGTK